MRQSTKKQKYWNPFLPDSFTRMIRRRRLLSALEELTTKYKHCFEGPNTEEKQRDLSYFLHEREWLDMELARLEQRPLIVAARKNGIEVPNDSWEEAPAC